MLHSCLTCCMQPGVATQPHAGRARARVMIRDCIQGGFFRQALHTQGRYGGRRSTSTWAPQQLCCL